MKVSTFSLLILLAACISGQNTESYKNYIASWSHDDQQILFYSDRNGNWDIYSVKFDGTILQQITSTSFDEREPNWHPQNNSYAFSSDTLGERRIFLRAVDSASTVILTDSPGDHSSPSWSPDGNYLAYLSEENKEWKLLVKDLNDSSLHILYVGSTYPGRPTWTQRNEVLYSVALNGKETLHLVTIDGTIVKKYTPGYNSCGTGFQYVIAVRIKHDIRSVWRQCCIDGIWEIYKMRIDDLSITRLTNNDRDDWGARWSRDGTRILFLGSGLNNTGYELFVMNAVGSGLKQLTSKE